MNRPTTLRKNTIVALSTLCEAKRIQTPIIENKKADSIKKPIALTVVLDEGSEDINNRPENLMIF